MRNAGYRIPVDGGGLGSVTKGAWYGVPFASMHYVSIQVWGTFAATYNIEVTLDPNAILVHEPLDLLPGAEGHADAATIPPATITQPNSLVGLTVGGFYPINNAFVALRINVTAYTSGSVRAVALFVP